MATSTANAKATPEALLRGIIAKFDAETQKLIRAVRAALKKRVPTANELVYDYGRTLVLAYTPTEHGIDGVLSLGAGAGGVKLYFGKGPKLPDPKKLLQGSAKQVRFIEIESARQLKDPDVEALIAAALAMAKVPLPAKGRGQVIDRSVAQQKRRQASK